MKPYAYDRESILMLLAAFAVVVFLASYMMHTDMIVFHIQSAILGAVMIVVALTVFRRMGRMKLIVAGIVVLSLTHISELVVTYMGLGEQANGVVEHSLFFIGILLIMQGLFVLNRETPAKK